MLLRRILKIILIILITLIILGGVIVVYIRFITNEKIYEDVDKIENKYEFGLILGAAVKNGKPSPMLKDRLDAGIELYKKNKVEKLIMSGDGRDKYYNEVEVMKNYAINQGVPESDILLDSKGLNTSASMKNLKEVYNSNSAIIVSQKFHINRALYLAEKKGLKAIAYPAKDIKYDSLIFLYIRDIFASIKDFILENF